MQIREEKANLHLEYIIVSFFILPLFLPFPDWYIILEIVLGIVLIGFSGLAAGTIWIMLANGKSAPVDETYFTWRRGFAIWVNVFILTSMYMQGLDQLFIAYLLTFLALNVGAYMWMKKPA